MFLVNEGVLLSFPMNFFWYQKKCLLRLKMTAHEDTTLVSIKEGSSVAISWPATGTIKRNKTLDVIAFIVRLGRAGRCDRLISHSIDIRLSTGTRRGGIMRISVKKPVYSILLRMEHFIHFRGQKSSFYTF